MNNKKFKVGDKVRIIDCSAIEFYELNKIGIITSVRGRDERYISYAVDMGRPRRLNEPDKTCWYLSSRYIELVIKKNQQLLFSFMY